MEYVLHFGIQRREKTASQMCHSLRFSTSSVSSYCKRTVPNCKMILQKCVSRYDCAFFATYYTGLEYNNCSLLQLFENNITDNLIAMLDFYLNSPSMPSLLLQCCLSEVRVSQCCPLLAVYQNVSTVLGRPVPSCGRAGCGGQCLLYT